jgi:hypothetical protein
MPGGGEEADGADEEDLADWLSELITFPTRRHAKDLALRETAGTRTASELKISPVARLTDADPTSVVLSPAYPAGDRPLDEAKLPPLTTPELVAAWRASAVYARSMDRPTMPAPKPGTPAVKAQYGVPYVHSAVYHAVLAFKRQVRLLSSNQLFITVRIFSAFFMAIVFGGLYYQVIAPPFPWPLRLRSSGSAGLPPAFSNGIMTESTSGCCVAAGRRQRWAQQVWALPQCRDAAPVRQHLGDVGRG